MFNWPYSCTSLKPLNYQSKTSKQVEDVTEEAVVSFLCILFEGRFLGLKRKIYYLTAVDYGFWRM